MSLRELYQEVILEHSRKPRNFGPLSECTCSQEGINPLCGDQVMVYLKLNQDHIQQATFEGKGCAISMASASLMTEAIQGKSRAEAQGLADRVQHALTDPADAGNYLGKLEALRGVKEFPARVKCATLAWHALKRALTNEEAPK